MPHEYEPDELIDALRRDGPRLADAFFRPDPDTDGLVKKSVGANTFRSFRGLRPPAAEVYRAWVGARMSFAGIADLGEVATADEFSALTDRRFADLRAYWVAQTRRELAFGAGRKLVNLMHKWLVRDTGVSPAGRARTIPFLHVPHDTYCLTAVRKAAATGDYGARLAIPVGASMAFLAGDDQYQAFQTIARGVAAAAGVPPICVDLLAWDQPPEE